MGATESDARARKIRFCDVGIWDRLGLEMGLRVRPNANDAMTTETDVRITKSMAISILTMICTTGALIYLLGFLLEVVVGLESDMIATDFF